MISLNWVLCEECLRSNIVNEDLIVISARKYFGIYRIESKAKYVAYVIGVHAYRLSQAIYCLGKGP